MHYIAMVNSLKNFKSQYFSEIMGSPIAEIVLSSHYHTPSLVFDILTLLLTDSKWFKNYLLHLYSSASRKHLMVPPTKCLA